MPDSGLRSRRDIIVAEGEWSRTYFLDAVDSHLVSWMRHSTRVATFGVTFANLVRVVITVRARAMRWVSSSASQSCNVVHEETNDSNDSNDKTYPIDVQGNATRE